LDRISLAEVRAAAREGQEVTAQAPDLVALKTRWQAADEAASRVLSLSMEDVVEGRLTGS